MKKNIPIYPIWICHPCGMKHGNRTEGMATWHENTCDICGATAAVTEPRDFGHLKDTWIKAAEKHQPEQTMKEEQNRREFEEWAKNKLHSLEIDAECGEYFWVESQLAWEAWQAARERQWMPIESAPRDGSEFVVYCPPAHGIGHMASLCKWHEDAGFCVDELREPTHWMPLPNTPTSKKI